jgi:hypothetical protein
MAEQKRVRRWMVPSKRAKGYAGERKEGKHMFRYKHDEPLTEYEKGIRSGYLLCQSDHAAIYKYKQAQAAAEAQGKGGKKKS